MASVKSCGLRTSFLQVYFSLFPKVRLIELGVGGGVLNTELGLLFCWRNLVFLQTTIEWGEGCGV